MRGRKEKSSLKTKQKLSEDGGLGATLEGAVDNT